METVQTLWSADFVRLFCTTLQISTVLPCQWELYWPANEYCTTLPVRTGLPCKWVLYYSANEYCTTLQNECCTTLPMSIVLSCKWVLYYSANEYCTILQMSIVLLCQWELEVHITAKWGLGKLSLERSLNFWQIYPGQLYCQKVINLHKQSDIFQVMPIVTPAVDTSAL